MSDFFRFIFGIHSVVDGSTCRLSNKYWDCHDYHESKGGNGSPLHFYEYECHKSGKKFSI